DNTHQRVLNNLNLTIRKGEKIGIIGESGEGKSTLLSILLRFQLENKGGIYIDGILLDIKNLHKWYNIISYVPQEVRLIKGTIAENIAFGLSPEQIDTKKVKMIIKSLQLDKFIDDFENGVNSNLGE